MSDYTVTQVRRDRDGRIRVWRGPDGAATGTTTFHPDAITCRMAEYGLPDSRTALDVILHEPRAADPDNPLGDPATAAGWVTSTGPDSEPVWLYRSHSTPDAYGAHRCRLDAAPGQIQDPDGLLDQLAAEFPGDPELFRAHRERVDMTRWYKVYGGFPSTTEMENS